MSSSELTINGLQEIEADDIECENLVVNGDLTVYGDQIFQGNQQITGNLTVNGTIQGNSNITISGTASATSFSGNGSNLTNLNASKITSGVLPVSRGGLGIGTIIPNKVCVASAGGTLVNTPLDLHWDNNNDRLGIRNSNPQYELDISGTAQVSALRVSGNTNINGTLNVTGSTTINSLTTINNELVVRGGINGVAFTDRVTDVKNFILLSSSNRFVIGDYGISELIGVDRPSGNTQISGTLTAPTINALTTLNFGGSDYRNAFSATGGLLSYNGTGQYTLTNSSIRNLFSATSPLSYDPNSGVFSASLDSSKWEQSGATLRPKSSLGIARVGIGFNTTVSPDSTLHLKNDIDPSQDTRLVIESGNPYGETLELRNSFYGNNIGVLHEPDTNTMILVAGNNQTVRIDGDSLNVYASNNSPSLVLDNEQFGTKYPVADLKYNSGGQRVELRAHIDGNPLTFLTTNSAKGSLLPTESMRLSSIGNLGIGTVSPTTRLDVYESNITISNEATSAKRKTGRGLRVIDSGSTTSISEISMYGEGTNGYNGTIEFLTKGNTDNYADPLGVRMKIHPNNIVSIGQNYDITKERTRLAIGQGSIISRTVDYVRPIPEFGRGFGDALYLWDGAEFNIFSGADWEQRITFEGTTTHNTAYWATKWNNSFMFGFNNVQKDNNQYAGNYTPTAPTNFPVFRVPVDTRCDTAFFLKTIARDRWTHLRAWLCTYATENAVILLGECATSGVDPNVGAGQISRNSSFLGPNNIHARGTQATYHEWLQFNIPLRYMTNTNYVQNGQVKIGVQLVYGSTGSSEFFCSGFATCPNPYSVVQRRVVQDVWRGFSQNQTIYTPDTSFTYNEEWCGQYTTAGRYIQFYITTSEYPCVTDMILTYMGHNNTWESVQAFDVDTNPITGTQLGNRYFRRGAGPTMKCIEGSGIYRGCYHMYIPKSWINSKYVGEWNGNYYYTLRFLAGGGDVGTYPRGYVIERATPVIQNL